MLTNGMNVGGAGGIAAGPGCLAGGAFALDVDAGQGLRLQIGNAATIRFFRLHPDRQRGRPVPLVRVGGQGGLLDNAVVEGGVVGGFDFKYDDGRDPARSGRPRRRRRRHSRRRADRCR